MSLRVWLPLDGNLRNLGCSEVTTTASGATVNTSGKIGSCYSFDGSNDFISLSGNTLYNIFKGGSQQFSICFWVYHNDATRAIIFGDYGLSGAIGFNVELTTSHGVRFYWNGSPDKNFNSTSYVAAQGWTHIVITYNGSILNIYRNGILSTDSWSGTLATKNKTAGQFYLGRDNRTGTTALNGRLNDFRIYDHCLSAAEVHEIAQGLVLHYKLDDIIYGAKDSSGYNHNGTINGNIVISSDTNRYNYSAQFDGVDDSITVPYNAICPENIFTFNLWFKKDALGSKNYETLFGGPGGFEMDTRAGSATTLSLYMASTRSTKRNLVTELSLGNWHMITMTRDGTKEKYYVNGIYQSEIDAKAMPTGIYRIGAWASNTGQNYYGLISDFRIYCTALSAQDIKQLYELGMKIDNNHNLHAFEVVENNNKISLNNKRQFKCNEVVESELTKFFRREELVETRQIIEY